MDKGIKNTSELKQACRAKAIHSRSNQPGKRISHSNKKKSVDANPDKIPPLSPFLGQSNVATQ